jgi:putative SOS response-associated peptidase YedK
MCGRFTLRSEPRTVAGLFDLPDVPDLAPRYNVAPTQQVPTVRASLDRPGRELSMMRWGLVPSWAADVSIGNRLINARGETVAEKPTFRSAFKRRRCLVPADGFYEWKATIGKKTKQPYHFTMKDGRPFAFAGLWESWQRDGEDEIESFTIVTTAANELLAEYHDRMPVILHPDDYDLWLDPKVTDRDRLEPLLAPYPPDDMAATAVNTLVNNPRNDSPECLEPAA